jgi:hypothetical protein
MILLNLLKILPPTAHAASITDSGAPGDPLGGYMVGAVAVVLETGALALVALRTHRRDADLVLEAGSGPARDEVATCALVAVEDLVAVQFVKAQPSKHVAGE